MHSENTFMFSFGDDLLKQTISKHVVCCVFVFEQGNIVPRTAVVKSLLIYGRI